VWGVGIPFFALFLLFTYKSHLHKLEVREKLGFLYNGYRKKHYYWEIIIIFRKIAMAVIFAVIASLGVITQVIFILLIIYL
jgi:hypothetical protein